MSRPSISGSVFLTNNQPPHKPGDSRLLNAWLALTCRSSSSEKTEQLKESRLSPIHRPILPSSPSLQPVMLRLALARGVRCSEQGLATNLSRQWQPQRIRAPITVRLEAHDMETELT